MRESGIRARHMRRFKVTTDSKHNLPITPNLLESQFRIYHAQSAVGIRHHLSVDGRSWLYLAIVLDLFNREVAAALNARLEVPALFLNNWLTAQQMGKPVDEHRSLEDAKQEEAHTSWAPIPCS